jgi:hypothetical protein
VDGRTRITLPLLLALAAAPGCTEPPRPAGAVEAGRAGTRAPAPARAPPRLVPVLPPGESSGDASVATSSSAAPPPPGPSSAPESTAAVPAAPTAAPPATLELDWPPPDAIGAPDPKWKAFQLLPDDDSTEGLECPRSRAAAAPADRRQHRCTLTPTTTLRIGAVRYWLGLTVSHSEWDGMYGVREDVVVLDPGTAPPRVVHTVRQWHKSVGDCRTTLELRRMALADLDADGLDELCVETVEEVGFGLFEVMKQTEQGRDWVPFVRHRTFAAFALLPAAGTLVRRADLDRGCTDRYYRPFVPVPPEAGDRLDRRRLLQGKQPILPCTLPWARMGCDPDERCPGTHRAGGGS